MTSVIATLRDRRTFFLGVNTGYVTDGLPDSRYIEFYRRRSSLALHCAIVGNVVVPGGHGSNGSTPTLTSGAIWGQVAAAINQGGSLPGIQLATAWNGYIGTRKFVGNDPQTVISEARSLVAKLGADGISTVMAGFDEASSMAIDHGYRHVQLHGAHGYLLNLLIDSRINPRAGAVFDRLSDLGKRLACAGIETSIRISLRTGDTAFDASGTDAFHDAIAALPFDYIDLSSGFYNIDKRLIYPARAEVLAERLAGTEAVAKRNPATSFILSGRAMQNVVNELPSNIHIGFCRDLIANPDFLTQPDRGCRNRNKCHYFSKNEKALTCATWSKEEITR